MGYNGPPNAPATKPAEMLAAAVIVLIGASVLGWAIAFGWMDIVANLSR